jgi:UDP-N-acetylmuramate--alanine ligase
MVNGGFVNEFETPVYPGNFHCDASPDTLVYEVDESDRSLTAFEPDIGVLLNIGADHYERSELVRVFGGFLGCCRDAIILSSSLREELSGCGPDMVRTFCGSGECDADVIAGDYEATPSGIRFSTELHGRVCTRQFGRHSSSNAAAVLAVLDVVCPELSFRRRAGALSSFCGVRQRFERIGVTAAGVAVVNDYAHNADKIGAAIQTARECSGGPLLVFFQPHGFGPLGFMRSALGRTLRSVLCAGDRFILLPVFYAGGTTSFTPTSAEVALEYSSLGLPVTAAGDRDEAASLAWGCGRDSAGMVLVLGGRDPSLRTWSQSLTI